MAQHARIMAALQGVGLIQRGGRGRYQDPRLLINGGSKPASDYQSHLHHLQDMVDILEMRGVTWEQIHIFSADGEDESADLAGRDSLRALFWLVEKTRLGRLRMPVTLPDAIACSAQDDQLAL